MDFLNKNCINRYLFGGMVRPYYSFVYFRGALGSSLRILGF